MRLQRSEFLRVRTPEAKMCRMLAGNNERYIHVVECQERPGRILVFYRQRKVWVYQTTADAISCTGMATWSSRSN